MKNNVVSLTLLILISVIVSCENKSEYERLVERQMNTDVQYDSIFLGYELGMERQHFFDHSWELNQQNIISGGAQIIYRLEELSHDARMVFYPEFNNDRIYRMPVEISYYDWAIWNQDLQSDSLIIEVVEWLEDIHGPGFIQTVHPELNTDAWIKIDGNRRISVYRKDDMAARIEFEDLSVLQSDVTND